MCSHKGRVDRAFRAADGDERSQPNEAAPPKRVDILVLEKHDPLGLKNAEDETLGLV